MDVQRPCQSKIKIIYFICTENTCICYRLLFRDKGCDKIKGWDDASLAGWVPPITAPVQGTSLHFWSWTWMRLGEVNLGKNPRHYEWPPQGKILRIVRISFCYIFYFVTFFLMAVLVVVMVVVVGVVVYVWRNKICVLDPKSQQAF